MFTIKCQTNFACETDVGIEHNNNCNNKNEPQNYEKTPVEARAHIPSEFEHKTELNYVGKNYVYDITMLGSNDMSESLETNACSHECSECSDTSSLSSDDDYEDSQNNNIESSGTKKANQRLNDLCPIYLNDIEIAHSEEEETITELVHASSEKDFPESSQNNRMRMAFGIILRLVLPFANGVARSIKGIRDVRFLRIIKSIASSRQALTNVIAFAANTISMSLSSVHVSHHLEPILKLMKIHKSTDGVESLPDSANIIEGSSTHPNGLRNYSPFLRAPKELLPHYSLRKRKAAEQPAPKCCTLNILAQPPPGAPVRADVVFIHGLHGSLVNTWKQGLWENERRPVQFERPPKPPVRPPKRPPHSRSTALHPPHKQKRARYTQAETQPVLQNLEQNELELGEEYKVENNNFSFICGGPKDIQVCDGMEYSFPTFRLQYDNGRQLQSELEAILNDEKSMHHRITSSDSNDRNHKKIPNNSNRLSSETNYSKCWPGDWLPIDCPGVRVIAVNYTTDQYLWRPLWKKKEPRTNLVERSREMAELLIAQRVGYGHPIIWVGHSKGGLFVKQIIVDAWESGRPAAAPFWRSARGAFFYSVPHRGSHLASIKAPFLSRSVELIDIEKNSKYLIDLHRRFAGLYHLGHLKIEVFSFVETALTLMSVLYLRIVGVDSADPGIGDVCGIHLDHREICKPRSRECILYKELVKMINKVC